MNCLFCNIEISDRRRKSKPKFPEYCSRKCVQASGVTYGGEPHSPNNYLLRFWSKVNKEPGHGPNGDCWEWTASTTLGYGHFVLEGKHMNASRVSFKVSNPEIILSTKDFVCHSCDNPPCCNPAHLFLGTHKENMQDMVSKGRSGGPPRKEGPYGTAWCFSHKSFLPEDQFHKDRSRWNGLAMECRECKRARDKIRNSRPKE